MNLQILDLINIDVLDQNGAYLGEIEYMDNISISNNSTKTELKSGPKMQTIYSFSSEYTSEVTATAVASTDLFKLLFGEDPVQSDKTSIFVTEKALIPVAGEVKLQNTPDTKKSIFVFDTTKAGERVELKLGDPTTTPTEYAITGDTITVDAAVEKVKVAYYYETKGLEFSKKAKEAPSVRLYALAKYVNLDTKQENTAVFEMLNAKVDPNFTLSASNQDMQKVDITISANVDLETGKAWSLKVAE